MAIVKMKGTYDILPSDSYKWAFMEDKIRQVCQIFNYEEIRTPIFEASELFHRTVGETSDLVKKETYDFIDRGERNNTLRPEGTAGVVRAVIENKLYMEPINKLFYIGSMFRYERPQKGRFRQFNQFGVECFGSKEPIMDAEVISLAVTIIKAFRLKGLLDEEETISASAADGGGAPCVLDQQRWEAVFRRERMPASIDRTSGGGPKRAFVLLRKRC